jgi:enamine deaminase RidA (YjgF/YER057c/UK114 family)
VLYSHVTAVEGKRQIFVSGQVPRDSAGNVVGKGDMRAQLEQVCENVKICLEAAGATLADLVQTTTYVTDIEAIFSCIDVRVRYFEPGMPTSTTVEVSRLAHPDFLVEISAVAVVG